MGLLAYGLVALAIIGALGGIGYKIRASGYDSCKVEWSAANEEQRKASEAENDKRRKEKDKADAENSKTKRDLAGLYTAYRSLRDQPRHRLLPESAPGAANPERASFDRSGLDNALSGFDRGVTGLLEEGDRAIVDLNTARKWAQTP